VQIDPNGLMPNTVVGANPPEGTHSNEGAHGGPQAGPQDGRSAQAQAPVRVALLEDQRIMRDSLAELLDTSGVKVVLSAGDANAFLSRLHQDPPDVAIIDLTLESDDGGTITDGLTILRELRQWHPDVRVLVLSGNRNAQVIERCYDEGAAGYLYKLSTDPESLVAAIRAVARGERLVPLQLAHGASGIGGSHESQSSQLLALTAREREVLGYIAGGADNLKIATFLKISERTVKAHVSSLYRKLGPENRAQLALLARQLGVRPPQGV
jgi:DNA-binding NarL/FixJ family response regulator